MPSLADIAPVSEAVTIRGTDVAVTGISAIAIAQLIFAHEEIRKMFSPGVEADVAAILELAPDVLCELLAAGTGGHNDPDAIAAAATLLPEEQIDLIEAILRVTAPRGVGPLVDRVAALAAKLGLADPSFSAPSSTSPKASKS